MNLKTVMTGFLFLNFLLMIPGQSLSTPVLTFTLSPQKSIQVEPKVKTYGFVHEETTGITSFVIISGKKMPIEFHKDSDRLAVNSLYALNWKIFLPNTSGKKLFLIGQYFPEPRHTRVCRGCADSEEYREFKLLDWYIIAPFKVVREGCEALCAYLSPKNLRTKSGLELKDFDDFDGRDNMDVRRFQRKKRLQ